jgi:hypothetical protein
VFNSLEVWNVIFRAAHRRERGRYVVGYVSLGCEVAPPADKPTIMGRLYLNDMRRSLSHTQSERVDRDRLEIKAFLDICLAS